VHELQNLGGGVAPWNVSQYQFFAKDNQIFGKVKLTGEKFPLIFFHFHKTDIYNLFGKVRIKSYVSINRNKNLQKQIYASYAEALSISWKEIRATDKKFKFNFGKPLRFIWQTTKDLVGLLLGEYGLS
jgi:hypothetical protein